MPDKKNYRTSPDNHQAIPDSPLLRSIAGGAGKDDKKYRPGPYITTNLHELRLAERMDQRFENPPTPSISITRKQFEDFQRYELLTRSVDTAICDWNIHTGELVFCKNGIGSVFGYENVGMTLSFPVLQKMIHPEDLTYVKDQWESDVAACRSQLFLEYRLRSAHNTYRNVEVRGHLQYSKEHKPCRLVVSIKDITEITLKRNRFSEELTRFQQNLHKLTFQAIEREKEMLGNRLLEDINQVLTASKMLIDLAMNDRNHQDDLLKKSHRYIGDAVAGITHLTKSLVPPSLQDIGLREALIELVQSFTRHDQATIKFQLTIKGLKKSSMPKPMQLMVYRIVQEQLKNIAQHARASKAEIYVQVSNRLLRLNITDNGIGFNTGKKTNGIGLKSIGSRVLAYNGIFKITSKPGGGTALDISFPL